MDTDFTRKNARGSPADAQAEIASGQICGKLPAGFNPKTYATKQWKIFHFVHDGFKVNLGARTVEIVAAQIDLDRKSTRLNSSHGYISYAVFCLKKKTYERRICRVPEEPPIQLPPSSRRTADLRCSVSNRLRKSTSRTA